MSVGLSKHTDEVLEEAPKTILDHIADAVPPPPIDPIDDMRVYMEDQIQQLRRFRNPLTGDHDEKYIPDDRARRAKSMRQSIADGLEAAVSFDFERNISAVADFVDDLITCARQESANRPSTDGLCPERKKIAEALFDEAEKAWDVAKRETMVVKTKTFIARVLSDCRLRQQTVLTDFESRYNELKGLHNRTGKVLFGTSWQNMQ